MFDIEEKIHNKHLGRIKMIKQEEINALASEQYRIRKTRAANIQEIKKLLLYNLIIL